MLNAFFLLLGFVASATAAAADNEAPKQAQACIACHGLNGNSKDPQYPILAGQTARYLYLQLKDFKEGRRSDPQMSPMAVSLSQEDMLALAQYFAAQKPGGNGFRADPEKVRKGQAKAEATLCTMCHQEGFKGQNEIPRVAGQHYQYIVKQLKAFRNKTRTNDAGNMTSVARNLTDEDIDDLANYVANLY